MSLKACEFRSRDLYLALSLLTGSKCLNSDPWFNADFATSLLNVTQWTSENVLAALLEFQKLSSLLSGHCLFTPGVEALAGQGSCLFCSLMSPECLE